MRITQQHQVDVMVKAIRDLQRHISTETKQIASGKRVNRPSDDPAAAERINQFRNVIRTTEHRLLSVEEGVSRLNLSDSALNTAGLTFQRAKELAIQMRNDTNSAVERREYRTGGTTTHPGVSQYCQYPIERALHFCRESNGE